MEQKLTMKVPAEKLKRIAEVTLQGMGLSPEDASLGAAVLNSADIRGMDTHGLSRLAFYARSLKAGSLVPNAELTTITESACTLALDANNGVGIVAAPKAMVRTIEKAKEAGVCVTTVRNSAHFGIGAHYAMMAAKENLISFVFSDSGLVMVPFGGKKNLLGNSPWCICFPGGNKHPDPLMVDMACSEAAFGKLEVAKRNGKQIPLTWGVDVDGVPTNDIDAIFKSRGLLPFGGHKGYCIAVMWEMLTAILGGAGFGDYKGQGKNDGSPEHIGHVFIVIDPSKLQPLDTFKDDIDAYVEYLKACPPAKGVNEVFLPGEIETRTTKRRLEEGVDFNIKLANELLEMLKGYNMLPQDAVLDDMFEI